LKFYEQLEQFQRNCFCVSTIFRYFSWFFIVAHQRYKVKNSWIIMFIALKF
jgi:hypothetical protein